MPGGELETLFLIRCPGYSLFYHLLRYAIVQTNKFKMPPQTKLDAPHTVLAPSVYLLQQKRLHAEPSYLRPYSRLFGVRCISCSSYLLHVAGSLTAFICSGEHFVVILERFARLCALNTGFCCSCKRIFGILRIASTEFCCCFASGDTVFQHIGDRLRSISALFISAVFQGRLASSHTGAGITQRNLLGCLRKCGIGSSC